MMMNRNEVELADIRTHIQLLVKMSRAIGARNDTFNWPNAIEDWANTVLEGRNDDNEVGKEG
jgi:hypothetical protein